MKDDERRTELQSEIHVLEKADDDIDAARDRIEKQAELVQEIERGGHDTSLALTLLVTLTDSLQAMVDHRKLILERIDHLRELRR